MQLTDIATAGWGFGLRATIMPGPFRSPGLALMMQLSELSERAELEPASERELGERAMKAIPGPAASDVWMLWSEAGGCKAVF